MTAPKNSDYVPIPTCTPPALRPFVGKSLPAEYAWVCPDDGIPWKVRMFQLWGGQIDVQWIVSPPAPTLAMHRALPVVSAIAVGATVNVTCTWPVAFPDATYTVEAILPAALIGKVTAAVKSQTAAGCVVALTATALVAAGSVIDVTAVRYA